MMIKNVVFDFGQVMVRFDPTYMVSLRVSDPDDRALLVPVIFDRRYWNALDAGTTTNNEVLESIRTRIPERLWDVAQEIFLNWIYTLPEIDGMREVVRECKERYGAKVYLLSNISTYFAEHANENPSLADFDGCIFSAVCGMVKPNADIFRHLCERFDLIPEETLFVDDLAANIEGAHACGINGYQFDGDAEKLRRYLQEIFK